MELISQTTFQIIHFMSLIQITVIRSSGSRRGDVGHVHLLQPCYGLSFLHLWH